MVQILATITKANLLKLQPHSEMQIPTVSFHIILQVTINLAPYHSEYKKISISQNLEINQAKRYIQ